MEGQNILIEKLEAFSRKFYKNQMLRGGIWFLAGSSSLFLLTSLLEYFGNFNPGIRRILFFAFLIFSLAVLIRFVIIPLLRLYRLGDAMSYDQAALIVGRHFPHVQDKLLNTLQLNKDAQEKNEPFLLAAIDQKTTELQPIPFHQAVNFKENLKYVKYAAIPLSILLIVLWVAPGFSDSSKRLVNYGTHYEPQAPFQFLLQNELLEVVQHEDVELELQMEGAAIPNEVYVELDGHKFKMKNAKNGKFIHQIKRVSKNLPFKFSADGFNSSSFEIKVLPRPTMLQFSTYLDYPAYTGLEDEEVKNTVDFKVPKGTKIRWKFNAKNTNGMIARRAESNTKLDRSNNQFSLKLTALKNELVTVISKNDLVKFGDSLAYSIQVIPDDFPQIELEQKGDTFSEKIKYLLGDISDDYGFTKLTFNYRFTGSNDPAKVENGLQTIPLKLNKSSHVQNFYHMWNLDELNVQADDQLEYYFEVWDNDGVVGPKRSRSTSLTYSAPSLDEIESRTEAKTEEIKDDIKESKKELKSLEKEMQELEQKMTEKKQLTWEEKKKIKELLQRHEQMQKQMQNVVEENQKNNVQESEFKELDQEIKQKQEELQELFKEVMDEETKKLMDEIQKLMDENRKDDLMKKMDQLQFSDKEVEKQMDRMLEQLKQLQLEKKVNETVKKLEELAKKQQKLSEETGDKNKDKEALAKKQEDLKKEFDKVKKDLEDIQKKNKDLEKPLELSNEEQKKSEEEVDKQQEESKENIQKNKRSKSQQNQQKAAEEMKKMSKELNQMMMSAMQQQQSEDYNTLREILENLVQVSKDQEELMGNFKATRNYNPRYVELGQQQKKLRDDARMIEDSLLALSLRVKQVESFINKEIGLVNQHMKKTMYQLGERNTSRVVTNQQYVMTSLNNLALMLSESLKQMQEQMKAKPNSGSCDKPGNNKKPGQGNSMKSLRQMQQDLKKQLEGMQKGMKQGQNPGSKQFAETAAMQAAIRKRLKEIKQQMDKEGKGNKLGNMGKTEQMMDDLERDLYNKRLNENVLKRQQEILTRLLEHEKAEREQEQDNKRKANEAGEMKRQVPPSIEDYLKEKEKEQELLRTLSPELTPYYKQKVREYFKELEGSE